MFKAAPLRGPLPAHPLFRRASGACGLAAGPRARRGGRAAAGNHGGGRERCVRQRCITPTGTRSR